MRKKSHLSLAKYMVESLNDEGLRKHRYSFYLGSILPDIKPSFLYKRHEIEGTFPAVSRRIAQLSDGEKACRKKGRRYYLDLGQISHYLADYFTFPHNRNYTGGFRDHCAYEEQLKHDLRTHLQWKRKMESGTRTTDTKGEPFRTVEALCNFIQKSHRDYLNKNHNVGDDILHIVSVNQKVLSGMIGLLARRRADYGTSRS